MPGGGPSRPTPAVLLALLLSACSGGAEERPAPPAPSAEVDEPAAADEAHHAMPDPAPARLASAEGTVTVDGAAAEPGQELDAGTVVEVPDGGSASLAFLHGARVVLEGEARARIQVEGGAQLLLLSGGAHLTQPPAGSSPRPPLRVATAAVTVEIPASGEAFLAAFPAGSAWLAVLSGAAEAQSGEVDRRRRLRTARLTAGRAVTITGEVQPPVAGPVRLVGALETWPLLASVTPPPEPDALRRTLDRQVERLDQALRWLEAETGRGRELTAQHRAAVRARAEDAQELQERLVDHSRALYRLRQVVRVRWERVCARLAHLEALGAPPVDDPVARRTDRVAGLLGF